jgi:hypothetical protein
MEFIESKKNGLHMILEPKLEALCKYNSLTRMNMFMDEWSHMDDYHLIIEWN